MSGKLRRTIRNRRRRVKKLIRRFNEQMTIAMQHAALDHLQQQPGVTATQWVGTTIKTPVNYVTLWGRVEP